MTAFAILMAVEAVLGTKITVAALPVAAAEPPICELALKLTSSWVSVIVPVLKSREAALSVKVLLPESSVISPAPLSIFVLA